MAITFTPETAEFLQTLEGRNLEITYAMLKIVEGIGIDVAAKYQNNIIVINRDGLDLFAISPRKAKYSLYIFNPEAKTRFLPRLGKIDDGVSCLRFNKWDDINPETMAEMLHWMLLNPVNVYGNFIKK